LDKVDPTIFVYGEGWTAANSPLAEEKRAVKKNAKQLNVAVFSDDIRDAIKGSWMHSEVPGFVSGTDSLGESIRFGVVGATQHPQVDYTKPIYSKAPYVNNPTQIINYVSCHDDMCLVDKLKESKPANASDEELKRFNKLAQTIVFTSQGVPFMYAGEELYRNKKGIHNTYQSPDSINRIDWNSKTTHKDVLDYYKGLIALRKAHAAFRMPTQEMVQNHLKFLSLMSPNVVGYTLTDHINGEIWKDILVIYNGNRNAVRVNIPTGTWNVVCHDGLINLDGISQVSDTTFTVAASSASIMYTK
jgi:pullulanase